MLIEGSDEKFVALQKEMNTRFEALQIRGEVPPVVDLNT